MLTYLMPWYMVIHASNIVFTVGKLMQCALVMQCHGALICFSSLFVHFWCSRSLYAIGSCCSLDNVIFWLVNYFVALLYFQCFAQWLLILFELVVVWIEKFVTWQCTLLWMLEFLVYLGSIIVQSLLDVLITQCTSTNQSIF